MKKVKDGFEPYQKKPTTQSHPPYLANAGKKRRPYLDYDQPLDFKSQYTYDQDVKRLGKDHSYSGFGHLWGVEDPAAVEPAYSRESKDASAWKAALEELPADETPPYAQRRETNDTRDRTCSSTSTLFNTSTSTAVSEADISSPALADTPNFPPEAIKMPSKKRRAHAMHPGKGHGIQKRKIIRAAGGVSVEIKEEDEDVEMCYCDDPLHSSEM